jgi:hypothetical protein
MKLKLVSESVNVLDCEQVLSSCFLNQFIDSWWYFCLDNAGLVSGIFFLSAAFVLSLNVVYQLK